MPEVRYLSTIDLIALHAEIMERTGYSPAPLRSEGGLESALMRPQMLAHYENADLVRQATALIIGISQAQAFLDGNKRTAFAAGDLFLRANGLKFKGDPVELAQQLEAVATREDDLGSASARFEAWLRDHIVPRE